MAPSPNELVDIGLDHLGRFAFFTRDNPFVSSTAARSLSPSHRQTLVLLLSGKMQVDKWLASRSAKRLLSSIQVGCVPRDVQLVTREGTQQIGVESVHAFLNAHLFWWLVSILWCLTAGRKVDPLIGEEVTGYRLHPGFIENPESNGVMFREHKASYRSWRRFPNSVAKQFPGEILATNSVDLQDFYYSAQALPGTIVQRFLELRGADKARSREARVLTRLLNELHREYGEKCLEVKPRETLTRESIPLPVGLPSSRILANLIVSLAIEDLNDVHAVDAVAAYADDFMIMTRELPGMAEPSAEYLTRLGVIANATPPILSGSRAPGVARLIVSLEKSATSYSRSNEPSSDENDSSSEGEVVLEDGDLDPYIDAQPDPDWGGRLRTVLRVPHRRERVPRELSRELERLVDEIRVGLDADEALARLERLITEIDSGLFLALRPYWTELLVSGIAARGRPFILELSRQFVELLNDLEPPALATEPMRAALRSGLRAAWIQALAQALAVALAESELENLEAEVPVLAESQVIGSLETGPIAGYARSIRSRRLIPGSLVSAPLAEFTSWKGRLIGPDAYRDFVDWANGLEDEQKFAQLRRSITRSMRFVHLHEICLALHLWVHESPSTAAWLSRAFSLLGRQPLIQDDHVAELRAKANEALHPPARSETGPLEAPSKPIFRFAIPSLQVDERQLDARILNANQMLGAIASASRRRTRSTVGVAVKRRADVLVLPEWAVLPQQLPWVMGQASASSMFTVAGEAPSIVGRVYSNRIWTGVPLEDPVGHRACLVPPPREKRYLSPHEAQPLGRAGIASAHAAGAPPTYGWNGIRVASLVCFEFADIATRTALRTSADVLTVSSLNKDWRYFDAIQEATTRDNYCLTVCVNTGAYPGTKIMRPTSSAMAVAASIHGSDDPAVVLKVIDMHPIVVARQRQVRPSEATDREPTDGVALADYKAFPPS